MASILPIATHEGYVIAQAGKKHHLYCQVEGLPAANVTWFFQEIAPGNFSQNSSDWERVEDSEEPPMSQSEFRVNHILAVRATRTGWYRCHACNEHGEDEDQIKFIVAGECTRNIYRGKEMLHSYF